VGYSGMSRMIVPGLATEISAGGIALFAGIILKPGYLVEIEFRAPLIHAFQVSSATACYCFGLEFVNPLPI
jgi:hypothetical protein